MLVFYQKKKEIKLFSFYGNQLTFNLYIMVQLYYWLNNIHLTPLTQDNGWYHGQTIDSKVNEPMPKLKQFFPYRFVRFSNNKIFTY